MEVIGAGAVTHPEDVQNWLQCTLLYHQSAWDEVHRVAVLALEYLAKNRFTEWTKEERYVPTLLGEATFCSSLPPQAAIWVAGELVVARKNFVLDTDLHLIYQVTPVNEGPEPNWEMMPHLLAGLSKRERKVAGLIGIEEGRLVLWANTAAARPRYGASDKHVVRAKRFFQALMLSALIREVPISAVSEKYRVPRGTLQSLQQQLEYHRAAKEALVARPHLPGVVTPATLDPIQAAINIADAFKVHALPALPENESWTGDYEECYEEDEGMLSDSELRHLADFNDDSDTSTGPDKRLQVFKELHDKMVAARRPKASKAASSASACCSSGR